MQNINFDDGIKTYMLNNDESTDNQSQCYRLRYS